MASPNERFHLFGTAAAHPRAVELAEGVHHLLTRYVDEVVLSFALCPFLHQRDSGLGAVGIVLDAQPDVATATAALRALSANVAHLVFPLSQLSSSPFERFGNKLAESVRASAPEKLVHASFHPELVGGVENAYRLIGLLRQSPDPFVQFIPHGLTKGGTVVAGVEPTEGHAEARFQRLTETDRQELIRRTTHLKAERRKLDALAAALSA